MDPTANGNHEQDTKPKKKGIAKDEEKTTIYHHFNREVHNKTSFDNLVALEKEVLAAEDEVIELKD